MKKISNPLTIIGLFAGIAEVAGTVVLPLVSPDLQRVFIWYVMMFPILLVVLFFITLNLNRNVLYAPSDFSNEENFMKLTNSINKSVHAAKEQVDQVTTQHPELSEGLAPIINSLNTIGYTARKMSNKAYAKGGVTFFSPEESEILSIIDQHPGITLSELEKETHRSRGDLTRILNRFIPLTVYTVANGYYIEPDVKFSE